MRKDYMPVIAGATLSPHRSAMLGAAEGFLDSFG